MAESSIHPEKQLREFFAAKYGIAFDNVKNRKLRQEVESRLNAAGFVSWQHYFDRFIDPENKGDEEERLLFKLTNNETYFFREKEHFQALTESVIPELICCRPQGRPVCIWSAGCSSGEEVYSIAIAIQEKFAGGAGQFKIIGSDVHRLILEEGRQGVYGGRTLKQVSRPMLRKYFEPINRQYRLGDEIRSRAEFFAFNLARPVMTEWLKGVDIIFCRNVLIYLNGEAADRLISFFHGLLPKKGALFLGSSEDPHDQGRLFALEKLEKCHFYQKK